MEFALTGPNDVSPPTANSKQDQEEKGDRESGVKMLK